MTKAPIPTENSTINQLTTQKWHQNFFYTTVVDRLRTVSWSNNSHPAGVVKGYQPFHSSQKSCINRTWQYRDFHKDGYMLKANKDFYTIWPY